MMIKSVQSQDVKEMLILWDSIENIDLNEVDDTEEKINEFVKRNSNLSYCIYVEGKMVACIIAGHDGRRGNIYHLSVHKDFRRQGLAKSLLEKVYYEFKRQAIHKINITVLEDAEDAKRFWNHINWKLRSDILMYTLEL